MPLPFALRRGLSSQILLVEDDDGQARLTARALERSGYSVVRAGTAREAFDCLDQNAERFVLLDLGLPDMDGMEVLSRVVARSEEIPVVVVTGLDDIKTAVAALQKGAWDYVVKRPDLSHLEELPHVIRRNLDRQGLVRERNLFLSMLSHDIKNPVQVILGYADMLCAVPEPDEREEVVERIKQNARRILQLVGDFVEVRRLEAGQLTLAAQPVRVAELVRRVVDNQNALAQAKKIALGLEVDEAVEDAEVRGDPRYLERVFTNLVDNALKYTPPNGAVQVVLTPGDRWVEIQIRDSGPGIPPEELPYVFDKYRRVRRLDRQEGSGLGLFIVRTVVERHGGEVGVESDAGKGSVFRVRLPIMSDPKRSSAAAGNR